MILLIDNNDSFTYNVVSALKRVTAAGIDVFRSPEISLEEVEKYSHVILSPGPGLPSDFPFMGQLLARYDSLKPILGICLGHQALCEYYGGKLRHLPRVVHGESSEIICQSGSRLFGDTHKMVVGRYHSWVVDSVPQELTITARDSDGLIMAIEHREKNVSGVQFHPESYITKDGELIFKNFLYGN